MLRFLTVGLGHLFRSRKKNAPETTSDADREMGFFDHLEELRSTLLSCLGAFTAAVVLAFVFSREIFDLMRRPLREAIKGEAPPDPAATAAVADPVEFIRALTALLLNGEVPAAGAAATAAAQLSPAQATIAAAHTTASGQGMVVMKFMDVFSILLNIGLVGGLALSSGFILYFVSRFVGPALTPAEKKCVIPFCLSAMLLFFGGCAFSFLWLIPVSIQVMFHFVRMFNLTMPWLASDYYGFVTMMTLLVGLAFQFPLVVVILQYLEIVKTSTLFRLWRHVLVGILVASLVISPLGDPVSLSVLTGVLFLLYITAASIGGVLVRQKIKRREAEEAEYERQYGKPHPDKVARETAENPPPETSEDYGNENYDSDYNPDENGESYDTPYDEYDTSDSTETDGSEGDDSSETDGVDGDSGDSSAAAETPENSVETPETASDSEENAAPSSATDSEPSPPATPSPDAENVAETNTENVAENLPAADGEPASETAPSAANSSTAHTSRIGRQSELDLIE